jgi:S-adenosyl-L-methionine hydrolase (adenosine-forming)
MSYDTITFLSDFGHADESVGVVRSVIRSIAPNAAVIDLGHGIRPYDIRGGGLMLARSAPFVAMGIVVAVVDPGAGSGRRAVAVEVGDGASILVGPDNGLLAPAVALVGGASRAVELTNKDYHLESEGPTFAGRDIFGPVAAHLSNGVTLDEIGTPIDPSSLMPGLLPVSREEDGDIVADVLWVDQFGNVQLNVDPEDIKHLGQRITMYMGETVQSAFRVACYDDIEGVGVGLVTDAHGLISIAARQASAATQLGLSEGNEVRLSSGGSARAEGIPVQLGKKEL